MSKKLKLITFTSVTNTLIEESLDIDVPEGKVIKINGVSLHAITKVAGTVEGISVIAGLGIKSTEQSIMTPELVESEADIGMFAFVDGVPNTGNINEEVKALAGRTDEIYSLLPTVFVGAAATLANTQTTNYMFVIDYDLVKLSTAIALQIAVT